MSGDEWLSPGTCGVKLTEFEAISRQMDKAALVLEDLAQQMWAILNSAGVDTGPAMKVKSMAKWADSAATDIRRRVRLVHEMDRQKIAMAGYCTPDGTYVTMPDRYKDQLAKLDGAAAADLIRRAEHGDAGALKQLGSFQGMASNPYFAGELLRRLGVPGLLNAPARLGMWLQSLRTSVPDDLAKGLKDSHAVLALLSHSLATATNPNSKDYVGGAFLEDLKKAGRDNTLTLPTGAHYNGYWALGQILRQSDAQHPFSSEFMKVVGRDMIAWDRTVRHVPGRWPADLSPIPMDPVGSSPGADQPFHVAAGTDPLIGLMTAAAVSGRESAQALFDDGRGARPVTLDYLLRDRWLAWRSGDQGDSLGKALEAAAKDNDDASKRFAVLITQVRADDIASFMKVSGNRWTISDRDRIDALSGLRDSMAVILGNHIDDVGAALKNPEHATRPDPGHEIMDGGERRAEFASDDLYRLLADIGRDEGAYRTLLWAQAAHMRKAIDDSYDLPGKNVVDWANMEAVVLGNIVAGYQEAQLAEGLSQAEAERKANDSTKALLDFGIGLIPVPGAKLLGAATNGLAQNAYERLGKLAYGDFGQIISNAQNSGALDSAFSKSAVENRDVKDLIKSMIETSAISHEGLNMGILQRAEAQFERENPSDRGLLFTAGSGSDLHVLPPDTWTREQWDSFHDYNADHNDPGIPDGVGQTQSLNKFKDWGAWGYNDGLKELQERLGINVYIPGGGSRP